MEELTGYDTFNLIFTLVVVSLGFILIIKGMFVRETVDKTGDKIIRFRRFTEMLESLSRHQFGYISFLGWIYAVINFMDNFFLMFFIAFLAMYVEERTIKWLKKS